MASCPKPLAGQPDWSREAYAIAAQARVVSGHKLEELVVRLQRHSGRTKDACWRFIIRAGLKQGTEHRRWTDDEIDYVREELVKKPLEEVAKKVHRTPDAVRNMLKRHSLSLREIRCDRFSLESLSIALRVRKAEIRFWISEGWLQAATELRGRKHFYSITPEALILLYKHHLPKILARGTANQPLFEAYVQYCYSPKHTVGTQLLDVRRDKKERAAYEAAHGDGNSEEEEDDDGDEDERTYHLDLQTSAGIDSDPDQSAD